MHRFYAFVGLVLTFEAPHITPPRDSASPPPRTSPRDSLAVRGALERWVAAWNSKNLEGMLATWSADAVESFPARSRAFPEIRASYEEYVSSSRTTRQSVEFQRIGTSGNLAFSEAIWSAVDIVRDSLGPHERPARHSRSLEIWQRQPDGRWLIVRSLAFGLPGSVAASSPADSASRARRDDAAIREALARYVRQYNSVSPLDAFIGIGDTTQIGWNARGDSIPFQLGLTRVSETARRLAADPTGPRRFYSVVVEEIIASGDLALVRDVWTTTRRGPDSATTQRDRSFELFRRQGDGSWKIFRWVDLPVGGAPPAAARRACAPSDSASEVLIRRRLADWVLETNRGDRAAAATIWAPAVTGWFPQGAEFRDSAAYAVAGRPVAKDRATSTYDLTIDDVVVSGDLAVVHDIWTERRRLAPDATVVRTIRGSETWRCQPAGDWRIARWVSAPEHWVAR